MKGWVLVAAALCLAAVYGPDVGHGFIKDDVAWIEHGRVEAPADLERVLLRAQGFYRPAVASTFAADYAAYGLSPRGYGFTNVLLLAAAALSLVCLGTGLGMSRGMAAAAAFIWMLNFHGINMAVLWLSGRTALLLCAFAFLAAGLFVRGRALAAGALTLLALLAKEEAVALPAMLTLWAWVDPRVGDRTGGNTPAVGRVGDTIRRVWPLWAALTLYGLLRLGSGAHVPGSAPSFYRFTFDPAQVVVNALHYADRAWAYAVITLLVASLAAWRVPPMTALSRRVLLFAALWVAGGFALTVFLPVRSSLYACFPSGGAALAAGTLLGELWTAGSLRQRQRMAIAAIVLLAVSYPVYRARNVRWVEIADLSAEFFRETGRLVARGANVSHLTVVDDRTTRRSFAAAYGTLLPTAVQLAIGARVPVWIEPPLDEGTDGFTRPAGPTTRVTLRGGRVQVQE